MIDRRGYGADRTEITLFRMSKRERCLLQKAALREGLTVSEICRKALDDYLGRHDFAAFVHDPDPDPGVAGWMGE